MTLKVGDTHEAVVIEKVARTHIVKYAGASGDFNPIHWSDRVATSVGLPGVIAHGMFTMALAARAAAAPRELVRRIKTTIGDMADVADHDAAIARELDDQVWSVTRPEFAERLAAAQSRISRRG